MRAVSCKSFRRYSVAFARSLCHSAAKSAPLPVFAPAPDAERHRHAMPPRAPHQERQIERVAVEADHLIDAPHLALGRLPELAQRGSLIVMADDDELATVGIQQADGDDAPGERVQRRLLKEIAPMIHLRNLRNILFQLRRRSSPSVASGPEVLAISWSSRIS